MILVSRKYPSINSHLTDVQARDIVKAKAPAHDSFAADLVKRFPKLSSEQHFWLHKKALELEALPKRGVDVGDFTRILTMFNSAAAKLQRPKISLMDDEGHQLRLSLAPSTGSNPGCVYVKDGDKNYMGKVTPEGEFFPARTCPATVAPYLRHFSADPEKLAAKYGKLTGECCFCCRPLSDARSTEVGYGPVCAERFGLQWGSRKLNN